MNNPIRYQDATITEYADGTEEVRFSNAEWEIMRKDPAFGYVRHCGHPTNANQFGEFGDCPICEAGYADYDDDGGFAPAGQS
jgi:hypothetical protein